MERQRYLKRLNRRLNAVGLLSVMAALTTMWVVGLRSSRLECEKLEDQHAQLERFLQTADVLHAEQQHHQLTLTEQRSATDGLLARVPQQSRETDFLDLLSETAQQTDVTLQNFRPLASQPGDHIGISQIRISGSGSYRNLVEFLDRLRQAPRMNRVSRLELGVADQARNTCTIELTLELFFNARTFGQQAVAS